MPEYASLRILRNSLCIRLFLAVLLGYTFKTLALLSSATNMLDRWDSRSCIIHVHLLFFLSSVVPWCFTDTYTRILILPTVHASPFFLPFLAWYFFLQISHFISLLVIQTVAHPYSFLLRLLIVLCVLRTANALVCFALFNYAILTAF